MNKPSFPAALLLCLLALGACAQGKKIASGKSYAKALDGIHYTATEEEGNDLPAYALHIVWNATTPPESLFFRPTTEWQTCIVYKGYKGRTGTPVSFEKIRKGDTLTVLPMRYGRDAVPKAIPASGAHTLFFTVKNSQWMALPIRKIRAAQPGDR